MMTNNDKGKIGQLDRAAMRLTGRHVHTGFSAPHIIIAANILFLLAALAGIFATARGHDYGRDLVTTAMIATLLYKVAVDFKERGYRLPDEREDAIRWKALAIGGWTVTVLVGLWAVFLSILADDGMWFPREADEWATLGMLIFSLVSQVSSITAACLTPPYAADLLDEE